MQSPSLRIGYDAHAMVAPDKGGGKGRQLRNILGKRVESFLGLAPGGPPVDSFPIERAGPRRYIVWQQTMLPAMMQRARLDVFLAPYNTAPLLLPRRTKLVLVLHDLIPLERYPNVGLRLRITLGLWRFLIPCAVRRAEVIITVSDYSKREILRRFPSKRVVVIPCTIPEPWFAPQSVVPQQEREDYILLVTSIEPHRNLDRALEAFARYCATAGDSAVSLRIAGVSKHAAAVELKIKRLHLDNQAIIEPYLSDQAMEDRIRRARAIYMPSLSEGFGIPVLEGMATGTPVICSDATSLPEVGADAVATFDPHDTESMTSALLDVLSSPERRMAMAEAGLVRAQDFHPRVVSRIAETFWTSYFGSNENRARDTISPDRTGLELQEDN